MSEDAHARPTRDAPEPLYDVDVSTPTHAERARTLIAQISTGTLCTLALDPEGYPYGSFVTVAFENGDPIFLISGLAEHTKNLERDPRASLLVAEGGTVVVAPGVYRENLKFQGRGVEVRSSGGPRRLLGRGALGTYRSGVRVRDKLFSTVDPVPSMGCSIKWRSETTGLSIGR